MTEVFTAETTIDGPVDAVWARLVDWDTAADGCRAWTSCAHRAQSPQAQPWSSQLGAKSAPGKSWPWTRDAASR
jgi:hypothetical protein